MPEDLNFARKELIGLPREQWANNKTFAMLCNVFSVTPDELFTLLSEELDGDVYEDLR